jgi:hypothetical protein
VTSGKPITEYQIGVVRRMIRQGVRKSKQIARRADMDVDTLREFMFLELAEHYSQLAKNPPSHQGDGKG